MVAGYTNCYPTSTPTHNMDGLYAISNPNPTSGKVYSTLYNSYPDVEYFDVYSPPISTRYERNTFQHETHQANINSRLLIGYIMMR